MHVTSAGSQPIDQLNPAVVQALAENGIDIFREFPKPLTAGKVQAADVVITMGCGDACPIYPGKRYLDWDLPAPAGLDLEAIRPIRDDIDQRVRQLLAALVGARLADGHMIRLAALSHTAVNCSHPGGVSLPARPCPASSPPG